MCTVASLLLGLLLFPLSAYAQTYPSRPVTIVVPFPAGGLSDVVARIAAEHMSKTLGQPIVIENVAGGTLGGGRVAVGGRSRRATIRKHQTHEEVS